MRIATIIALIAVLLTGTALAGDSENGCKLPGTWYGVAPGMGTFVLAYSATGDNTGTDITEWVKLDPALQGLGIAKVSSSRGIWTKTGPKTYDFVILTFFYLANGEVALISRSHGVKNFTDCNTVEVRGTFVEYLTPDWEVWYTAPDATFAVSHRLVLEDQ